MALYVSQFGSLPHSVKAITLLFTISIILCILLSPYSPPGTFIVWISVLISLLANLSAIAIHIFELEDIMFPVRSVSYAMLESLVALLLSILYFVSIWMCVNARDFSPSIAWSIAGALCFFNTIAYFFDFGQYFRIWLQETRDIVTTFHVENPNYGV